jgi:hypothetical protein
MKEIDLYFLHHPEPAKSCLLALRELILNYNVNISEAWKYRMPFYCYDGKIFCYLWVHKKYKQPYLGIVEGKKIDHPQLLTEKRSRMKILLLDPTRDIPIKTVDLILRQALRLYK